LKFGTQRGSTTLAESLWRCLNAFFDSPDINSSRTESLGSDLTGQDAIPRCDAGFSLHRGRLLTSCRLSRRIHL
jgi:hypothetical protein